MIADGKLAIILGVEASEKSSIVVLKNPCSEELIEEQLVELYDLGVRSLFPAHKFDNQLAGLESKLVY